MLLANMFKRSFLTALVGILVFSGVNARELEIYLVTLKEVQIYSLNSGRASLSRRESLVPAKVVALPNAEPLQQAPDREALLFAYVHNFLDCGDGVQETELLDQWVKQRLASTRWRDQHLAEMIMLPLKNNLVLLTEGNGSRGVVLDRTTGKRLSGSPCGVAAKFVRLSSARHRLVIVFDNIKRIDFMATRGGVDWSSKRSEKSSMYVLDLGSSAGAVNSRA